MENMQSNMELLNYIKEQKNVVVWGTAFLGIRVARKLYKNGISISKFWDKTAVDSSKCIIEGKEFIVNKPFFDGDKDNTLIIICIGNNILRNKLTEELKSNGYNNILSYEEHHKLFKMALVDEIDNLPEDSVDLKELTLKKRLEMAVDYAIQTEYSIWNRQYVAREFLRIAQKVCIYGVDEYMSDFFAEYCNNNGLNNVKFLCDDDSEKWGKIYNGIQCISPNELYYKKDCTVLILSANEKYIASNLNNNGIKNYLLSDLELNVFDKRYNSEWFANEKENILNTIDIFDDELSKNIYVETICNRIAPHLALKSYSDLQTAGEYFGHGLFELTENEVLVDAGAYTGDSLFEFLRVVNKKYDFIYLFEMEKNNFEILNKKVSDLGLEKILPINKGVYNENRVIEYSGNKGGTNISVNSGNYAEVAKLDDELKDKKVTFIKMDIEGSEMEALKGAEDIITKQSPKLAISVYHHLSDIWKIPSYIKSISKDGVYKICLRHHSRYVWDTDCYFF